MSCCHADFALTEIERQGLHRRHADVHLRRGLPRRSRRPRARARAARASRCSPIATLRDSAHVARCSASLTAAGIDVVIYDEVSIEPTTASLQAASRFAAEGKLRRLRIGRRRLGDGHVQGGESLCDAPRRVHDLRQCADRRRPARCPARVKPHIACPTTSGTGSETTGIAIFNLTVDQREDRHHLAPPDPDASRWSIPT